MRILLAISFVLATGLQPAGSAELTARQLTLIYPPGEHCLFIPPPDWPGLYRLDHAERPALIADRMLALRSLRLLQSQNAAVIAVLQPDIGLTQSDFDRGGRTLRRTITTMFAHYVEIWRSTRAHGTATMVDLTPFAPLQSACSRRAVMILHDRRQLGVTATVISLITGNRLAALTSGHLQVSSLTGPRHRLCARLRPRSVEVG